MFNDNTRGLSVSPEEISSAVIERIYEHGSRIKTLPHLQPLLIDHLFLVMADLRFPFLTNPASSS